MLTGKIMGSSDRRSLVRTMLWCCLNQAMETPAGGCRLDAIRLEAVFQTLTSHCTAHFETKERKLGGRHAQSKKVGLEIFDEIAKAVVSPLFHPNHCNIFKPPDIVALLFCKFYTFVKK